MNEKIDLELFTVAELRDWLIHNQSVRGLSEALISKQRAYAIVMNPNAKDDMPIVSALFVNDEMAAYTACFPDVMERPKGMLIHWCTTLYVSPKYEGRGYAYVVLQQLIEVYGETFFDLDAAEASQANISYTGLQIDYVNQYILRKNAIDIPCWIPKVLRGTYLRRANRMVKEKVITHLKYQSYKLEYMSYMDDATYDFIKEHSKEDQFLRSQQTFTWMLQYGFRQECPLIDKVEQKKYFTGGMQTYRIYGVRVIAEGETVGFYILRNSSEELSAKYVYYTPEYEEVVFASIVEHLLTMDNYLFVTHHKLLADYVIRMSDTYQSDKIEKIAFSHPKAFEYKATKHIQGGDGDMVI